MAVYALFTGIPHGMEDPKEATLRLFPNTTSDDVVSSMRIPCPLALASC